jgi:chromosome segregation ATPase
MATATTESESPSMDEIAQNDQVEENIDLHTDESTVTNVQTSPEGAEADVAGRDGLQEYREQLKQRLDEELTGLEATQDKVADRLQTENESGNIEDSESDSLSPAADVSQERADILSIVRSLERQTSTSTKLRDVLEDDVDSLQKKLSKETDARAQLEEKLRSLETGTGTTAQLRQENASLKNERDRLATLLEEIRPHLESVTEGRDSLSEEMTFAQKRARELASKKADLETQVKRLQEKVADSERLRAEVTKITDEHQVSAEQVRRLMDRLEEANKVRDTLEADLAESHEAVCNMRKEMEELRDDGTGDGSQASNLRNQLIAQSTELAAANEKIQQETAARRQTEEMLREIKTRLLSLSKNKSVANALSSSRG